MDQQFSNILRGTRQFFQGVPTSSADGGGGGGGGAGWPYQLFPGVDPGGTIAGGASDGGGGEPPAAGFPPQQQQHLYPDRTAASSSAAPGWPAGFQRNMDGRPAERAAAAAYPPYAGLTADHATAARYGAARQDSMWGLLGRPADPAGAGPGFAAGRHTAQGFYQERPPTQMTAASSAAATVSSSAAAAAGRQQSRAAAEHVVTVVESGRPPQLPQLGQSRAALQSTLRQRSGLEPRGFFSAPLPAGLRAPWPGADGGAPGLYGGHQATAPSTGQSGGTELGGLYDYYGRQQPQQQQRSAPPAAAARDGDTRPPSGLQAGYQHPALANQQRPAYNHLAAAAAAGYPAVASTVAASAASAAAASTAASAALGQLRASSSAAYSMATGYRWPPASQPQPQPVANHQPATARSDPPAATGKPQPAWPAGRSDRRRSSGEGQLLDLRPASAAPPVPADTGQPRKRLSTEVLDLSVRSRDAEERPRSVMPTLPSQSVARQQRQPRPESVPPPARAPLDTLNSPPPSRPPSQAPLPPSRADGFRSPAALQAPEWRAPAASQPWRPPASPAAAAEATGPQRPEGQRRAPQSPARTPEPAATGHNGPLETASAGGRSPRAGGTESPRAVWQGKQPVRPFSVPASGSTTIGSVPLNFSPRASPSSQQTSGGMPPRASPSPQLPRASPSPQLTRASPSPQLPRASPSPQLPRASPSPQLPRASSSPQLPRASPSPQLPRASPSPQLPRASPSPQLPRASPSPHLPRASPSPQLPPGKPQPRASPVPPPQPGGMPATRPDHPPGHPPGHPASRPDPGRQEMQANVSGRPAYGGQQPAELSSRFGPPPPPGRSSSHCSQPYRPPGGVALQQPMRPGFPGQQPDRMPPPQQQAVAQQQQQQQAVAQQQQQAVAQQQQQQAMAQQQQQAAQHYQQQQQTPLPSQSQGAMYPQFGQMGQPPHPAMRPGQQQQQQQHQHQQQQRPGQPLPHQVGPHPHPGLPPPQPTNSRSRSPRPAPPRQQTVSPRQGHPPHPPTNGAPTPPAAGIRRPGLPQPPPGFSHRPGQPPVHSVQPFTRPVHPALHPNPPSSRPLPAPWRQNGPLGSQPGPAGGKRPADSSSDRPSKVPRRDSLDSRARWRQPSGDLTEASSLEELLRNGLNGGTAGHSPQDLALLFPNMMAASSPEKHVQPLPPPPAPAQARSPGCAGELDIYNSVTSFINESVAPREDAPGLMRQPEPRRLSSGAVSPRGGRTTPASAPSLHVAGAPVEFRRAQGPFMTPEQERCLEGQLSRYERQIRQVPSSQPSAAAVAAAARVRTKAEMKSPSSSTASAAPQPPPAVRQSTSTESSKSVFDFDSGSDGEVPVLSHKSSARAKMEPPPERPLVDVFGDTLDSDFWGSVCNSLAENIESNQKLVKSKRVTRTKIVSKLQEVTSGKTEPVREEEPEPATLEPPAPPDPPPPPPQAAVKTEPETEEKSASNAPAESAGDGGAPPATKPKSELKEEKKEKSGSEFELSHSGDDDSKSSESESQGSSESSSESAARRRAGRRAARSSDSGSSAPDSRRPARRRRQRAVSSDSSDSGPSSPRRPVRRRRRRQASDSTESSGSDAPAERRLRKRGADRAERRVTRSAGGRRQNGHTRSRRAAKRLVFEDGLPARTRRKKKDDVESDSNDSESEGDTPCTRNSGKTKRDNENDLDDGRSGRRKLRRRNAGKQPSDSADSGNDRAESARNPTRTLRLRDGSNASEKSAARDDSVARGVRAGRASKTGESATKSAKPRSSGDETGDAARAKRSNSESEGNEDSVQKPSRTVPSADDGDARREDGTADSSVARRNESSESRTIPSILDVLLPPHEEREELDIIQHYGEDYREILERVAEALARQRPRARFARERFSDSAVADAWAEGWQERFFAWKTSICRVPARLVPKLQRKSAPEAPGTPTRKGTPRKETKAAPTLPRTPCRTETAPAPPLDRKSSPRFSQEEGGRRERHKSTSQKSVDVICAKVMALTGDEAAAGQLSQRFVVRSQRKTRVDIIEARLLASVRKQMSGGDRSPSTPNGPSPAQEPIVSSLVKKYKSITERKIERRMGALYSKRSELLHYSTPSLLATPRLRDSPVPAALLFPRATVERFPRELAESPLADGAAPAVVLDSRTRGARAQITETELLHEVFGVALEEISHLRRRRPAKKAAAASRRSVAAAAAGTLESPAPGEAPADTPPPSLLTPRLRKLKKRRSKNRSGFDFMLKKKRKKETDTDSVVPRNKKLLPVCGPRMGADPTRSPELAAEIRSWVLNKSAGETALLRAAKLGYLDAVIYLLETGDDSTDCRDNASFTPLHEACARGHLDVAKTLLLYGADVNVSAKGGVRPLHEAVENNQPEVVRLLLAYGSDPRLPTYAGWSPLEQCANMPAMKRLLRGHVDDLEGTASFGWNFVAGRALEPWPSGLLLDDGAPPFTARADDANLTFDLAAAPLPAIYRRLNDSQPAAGVRYVSLPALARHLACSEEALLRDQPDLQLLELCAEDAAELVCQTVAGWALQAGDQPSRLVRLDRDVEALLKRDRFNMTC